METFESFESLFKEAILWGDIDYSDDPGRKSINQTYFEWEFSIWLQNNAIWKLESEDITRFLTKKNWEQFMGEKALWERRWENKNKIKPTEPAKRPKYNHNAELLGLFCALINDSGVEKRRDGESVEAFCERICVRFDLEYRLKVSKFFNVEAKSRELQIPKLQKELLPGIGQEIQDLILKYLEKEQLIPERLYG
jgi:hypothetical protein